jgi:hypothetical protein
LIFKQVHRMCMAMDPKHFLNSINHIYKTNNLFKLTMRYDNFSKKCLEIILV